MDCVLCSVPEREEDRIVYQDDSVFVCMNHAPLKPGHMMVIPKRHAERINDLTAEEAVAYNNAIELAMKTLKEWGGREVIMALNGWDYRSQPHLHVQIMPASDNVRLYFAKTEGIPQDERGDDQELVRIAGELKTIYGNMCAL